MGCRIRSLLANKVLQALGQRASPASSPGSLSPQHLLPLLRINVKGSAAAIESNIPKTSNSEDGGAGDCSASSWVRYEVSLRQLRSTLKRTNAASLAERSDLLDLGSELVQRLPTDDTVPAVHLETNPRTKDVALRLAVPWQLVCNDVLHSVLKRPDDFWKSSSLLATIPQQRVVVDYSSPNIAKPFHVGHLRSTILGECLCRLHCALGHTVTRLNYLGDWGTQFGLLRYGFNSKGLSRDDLREDAIKKLYEVYVWANKAKEADPDVSEKAKAIFAKMEAGDAEELDNWSFFRDISIKDLRIMYARLGIQFDEYHGESMYSAARCDDALRAMEARQLLLTLPDGRKVFEFAPQRRVTIVKSDGSSIYLSRDIAAALDRYQRYSFDRHYYVVDMAQLDHFKALFSALSALGHDWSKNMRHIRFGRIKGLSSRKGNALFLSDLLDDGREQMLENQTMSHTTAVSGKEAVLAADTVALSAVVVADLRQRRHKDYNFSWQAALQASGDTGVGLQYTHCRLVRLQETCGVAFDPGADTTVLTHHNEARLLMANIARFDEVLYDFHQELEPSILVAYLFKLRYSVKLALQHLSVRDAPPGEATARLALFVAARHSLAAGLTLLGLKPLLRM